MTTNLKTVLEAVLFVADSPLSLAQLTEVVDSHNKDQVRQALEELAKEYDFTERSFDLVQVAGGYLLRTRPELAYWLRRLRRQQVTRLSKAALETLSIVAYKQPVLKAEIERLRGVEVGGILRTLLNKTLVKVVGRKDLPGRPLIYGTTKRFLEVFDLGSLKDLPTLDEMADLGDEGAGPGEPSLFDVLPDGARDEPQEPGDPEALVEDPATGDEAPADNEAPAQDQPTHDDQEPEQTRDDPDEPPEPEAA